MKVSWISICIGGGVRRFWRTKINQGISNQHIERHDWNIRQLSTRCIKLSMSQSLRRFMVHQLRMKRETSMKKMFKGADWFK